MIITNRRDKDYTSRLSPNRNRLLQPCLSGGETWGWGRGRLVPINTQQLTEPRRRKTEKKTEQSTQKKQSTQNTTQKKYRVKNRNINPKQSKKPKKKTEHKPKNIYTEKERKTEGSHRSALFSSLQENNWSPNHQLLTESSEPTPALQLSSPSPETESSRTPPALQPSSQSPETGAPVSICFCSSVFKLHLNSVKVI